MRRAAAEADLRQELAQSAAREEMVREIHEVLGNRLSLLTIHAGALTFRHNAPTAQTKQATEVIRESAHLALEDLRKVIHELRAPNES